LLELLAGRLLRMVVTLWVIGTVVFFATRLTGNPVDFLMPEGLDATSRKAMIAYWGLDHSYAEQYRRFWSALLHGEFGIGIAERRPVATIMGERIWQSATLLLSSVICTILVGIPLGILAAIWRQTTRGTALLVAAFLGYAIPNFVLAISLILIFSFTLHWLPSSGSQTWVHYIMPTAALSAYFVAALVRYTRNAMLDVLSQDYMRTARAKGLSERMVIFKHGLGNALIPVITILGLQVTTLVSGAVVVETVFAWPGLGRLIYDAVLQRDYPVMLGIFLVMSVIVIVLNLVTDVIYRLVDPRVTTHAS